MQDLNRIDFKDIEKKKDYIAVITIFSTNGLSPDETEVKKLTGKELIDYLKGDNYYQEYLENEKLKKSEENLIKYLEFIQENNDEELIQVYEL